ncbi:MAG: dihydroorotate dehydrogenase electron transfer subunit [Dehalococcoidia bacterium]|nr:dihydroorotate dehydrogenase electron transfer subunit [Dehalococcoidia bacterium]
MKQILAPILSNTEILPAVHLLWAHTPEIATEALPGQFVMVRCSGCYGPLLRRPLSIHRILPPNIALLFAVVGRGTKWLAQRKEGEVIDLLGPLGRSFEINSRNLLLVAGGIGIAPLVALAEKGIAEGADVTLLLGAPTQAQLYPAHLLPPQVKLWVATEDGSAGKKGLVTDLLPGYADWADQIFACGPISMYEAMAALIKGEKSVQVSMEARMGCGFGGCYGCAIETRSGVTLVCKDGPVFELGDIIWKG